MNPPASQHKPIPSFDEVVAFHGHACPGLALGYRVAVAAMARLAAGRAADEDLVAVVENDACSVDAIQWVCGCTFGKGNLIFRDHGKQAYTFFNRAGGKGLRIYAEPPETAESEAAAGRPSEDPATDTETVHDSRKRRVDWLLSLPEEDLLRLGEVLEPPPSKAHIHASSRCALCGECMMETRACKTSGRILCVPCGESLEAS